MNVDELDELLDMFDDLIGDDQQEIVDLFDDVANTLESNQPFETVEQVAVATVAN